jgi:hypothetical protein
MKPSLTPNNPTWNHDGDPSRKLPTSQSTVNNDSTRSKTAPTPKTLGGRVA